MITDGYQHPQVPKQPLVHVVLHVGHGVSKRAVKTSVLSADLAPHLREQLARGVTAIRCNLEDGTAQGSGSETGCL